MTFLFSLLKWSAKLLWRLVRQYGLVAVIIIYLCRSWLFSGPICRLLEQVLKDKAGLPVKIERLGGSYVGGISLHHIELPESSDDSQPIKKLKIEKISVSYNILAPLFGEKILQKITIERPEVELFVTPVEKPPEPTSSTKINLVGVDFAAILANSPNIAVVEANLSCRMPQQSATINKFTFRSTPQGGNITVDKIAVQNPALPGGGEEFDDLYVGWQFAQKILAIHECRLSLPHTSAPYVIPDPLHLDLASQRLELRKVALPLPGNIWLQGTVHPQDGCHLELQVPRLRLADLDPFVRLVYGPCQLYPAEVTAHLYLDLPQWDFSRLDGRCTFGLHGPRPALDQENSNNTEQADSAHATGSDLAKTHGLRLAFTIADLQIVEEILHSLGLVSQTGNVAGKLAVSSQLELQAHQQLHCIGEVSSDLLTAKPLEPAAMKLLWNLTGDLAGRRLELQQLALQWAQAEIALHGELVREQKLSARLQGDCIVPTVAAFLPEPLRSQVDVDSQTSWQLQAEVAIPDNSGKAENRGDAMVQPNFTITGQQTTRLHRVKAMGRQLENIVVANEFQATPTTVTIPKLTISWQDRPLLELSLNSGIRPGTPFAVRGKLSLPALETTLRQFMPELAGLVSGDLAAEFVCQGILPEAGQTPGVTADLHLSLSNGKLQNYPCQKLELSVKAAFKENVVQLEILKIGLDGEELVACQGKFGLLPDAESSLVCRMGVVALERKLAGLVTLSEIVLPKSLECQIECHGVAQKILAGQSPLQTKVKLALHQGKFPQFAYETLALDVAAQAAMDKLTWNQTRLRYDGQTVLETQGALAYRTGEAQVCWRLDLPKIERHLAPFASHLPPGVMDLALADGLPLLQGNLRSAGAVQLQLPLAGQPYHGSGKWRIVLQNGVREFSLASQFSLDPDSLTLQSLYLQHNQDRLLDIQGQVGWKPGKESRLQGQLLLPKFERYLPQSLAAHPSATGSVKATWLIAGVVPMLSPLSAARLTADFTLVLSNGQLLQQAYTRLGLTTQVEITSDTVVCKKLSCDYDNQTLLEVAASLGYQGNDQIALNTTLHIGRLVQKFRHRLAGLDGLTWNGDCAASLQLQGRYAPAKQWLDLQSKISLPLLAPVASDEWQIVLPGMSLRGRKDQPTPDGLQLRARIQGNWNKPSLDGQLTFFLHQLKLQQQDFTARDVSLSVQFQPNHVMIASQLLLGGSLLKCQGEIGYQTYLPDKIQLHIAGKRLLFIRTDQLYGRGDLDITITGGLKPQGPGGMPKFIGKIQGQIDVTEFNVSLAMSLEGSGERVFIKPSLESPFADLEFDLHINIPKVIVNNNLVKMEIGGNLHLAGDLEKPKIKGWFTTKSGKLFLPQGVMNITECIVRLKPEEPFLPYVEVKAETQVRDYRVFVMIQGPPTNLVIEFYSLPPLKKEDIILLLLTGATQSELGESAAEKAKETGSFILLQQLLNYFGIGDYVSAQVTESSAAINITPPEWKGFALQGKVAQGGKVRFNLIYRWEFK